jgi:O-methyltransferase involved in polyketide biosynthesis
MALTFAKIGLTAKLTAYLQQFTDIPFAQDVANLVRAKKAFAHLLRNYNLRPDDLNGYAPIFEARYKSIGAMIRRTGVRQILELAAGFSSRGLAMTADAGLRYVEIDREEIAAEKVALISAISRRHRLLPRDNLRVLAANILEPDPLQAATNCLRAAQPVAIVHEGLLQYLSSSETETVARNIHEILGAFGGVWITPDLALKSDAANVSDRQKVFQRIVAETTDRTMYNNAFENVEHVREYFKRLGFQVEMFNQLYLAPNLVSIDRLRLAPDLVDELRPRLRLWMLSR